MRGRCGVTIFHLKHSPINWMRFILGVQHYSCWVQHACPASLSHASLVWLSILKYNFLHATRFHINTDSKSLLLPCAQVEESRPRLIIQVLLLLCFCQSMCLHSHWMIRVSQVHVNVSLLVSRAALCIVCRFRWLPLTSHTCYDPAVNPASRSSLVHQHTLCQLSLSRPGLLTHKSCAV